MSRDSVTRKTRYGLRSDESRRNWAITRIGGAAKAKATGYERALVLSVVAVIGRICKALLDAMAFNKRRSAIFSLTTSRQATVFSRQPPTLSG